MRTPPRAVVATAVLVAVVALAAGCSGETRFVVVNNEGRGASAPTPAGDGSGATPTTATDAAAPATKEEEAAIKKAVALALTVDDRPFSKRLAALDGGDDLETTFTAVAKVVEGLEVEVTVESVTVNGDEAVATTNVDVAGSPYAEGLPVTLVRKDGAWFVTRAGACAVLALGSPCPDA